jgi:hypothetical protein
MGESANYCRQSWYSRTWPRKAAPVTEVARESISSAGNAAAVAASTVAQQTLPKPKRSDSLQLTLGKTKSRSTPVDATTTKVHATPQATSLVPNGTAKSGDLNKKPNNDEIKSTESGSALPASNPDNVPKQEPAKQAPVDPGKDKVDANGQADGASSESKSTGLWLGWLSRSGGEPDKPLANANGNAERQETIVNSQAPPMEATRAEPNPQEKASAGKMPEEKPTPSKRSWLQMWGNDSTPQSDQSVSISVADGPATAASTTQKVAEPASNSKALSTASSLEAAPPPQLPGDGSKSAGWVFWSRDKRTENSTMSESNVGEIAISNTPSQTRPKRTSISLQDTDKPKVSPAKSTSKTQEAAEFSKPQSKDARPTTPISKSQEPKSAKVESPAPKIKAQETPSTAQLQKSVPNILLPSFKDTFALHESPTFLEQLGRLLYITQVPELKHLHRLRDPPRIRRAIAIGVHGYFPAPVIRNIIGQPTGTSIKFSNMAANAINNWTQAQGYSCEVKTAALEGEGRIAERIELLWKLLLNWIDEIRKADFIMVACHSQGVPVAMMLVAKLIDFGCLNPSSVRIGVCAMAGVNMGPFSDYKSRWISGSAGELFEFSDPESTVSKSYVAALETVLQFGARVSFTGSIDDQLVSLESSIFAPVSHPHIYRAVFIDGRVHTSNFIAHLVGFVLKLRNLGVLDHGLIRELSAPLAGSLYGGEGHSRIYEDEDVYALAVEFALETTSINNTALTQRPGPTTSSNPYILPFAMRGILEEDYVKKELQDEALDLLKQFDEWKPTTKGLKDVKFRLEGIRSKL